MFRRMVSVRKSNLSLHSVSRRGNSSELVGGEVAAACIDLWTGGFEGLAP